MKVLACITILAIVASWPGCLASNEINQAREGPVEDCATTSFKIANNRVYLASNIIKYTKLQVGQGTMDCMALCRALDECWSFNFSKAKKYCYLSSDAPKNKFMRRKRKYLWSSGYKQCTAHSDDTPWDNVPGDNSDLAANLTSITTTYPASVVNPLAGTINFIWVAGPGTAALNGAALPTYRVICGENTADFHCDEGSNAPWTSGTPTSNLTYTTNAVDFETLFGLGNVKCFVETYINGVKSACSNDMVENVNPVEAPVEWQPTATANNTIVVTGVPYHAELTSYFHCTQNAALTCQQLEESLTEKTASGISGLPDVDGLLTLTSTACVDAGNHICYLYTENDSGVPGSCSSSVAVTVAGSNTCA